MKVIDPANCDLEKLAERVAEGSRLGRVSEVIAIR
jgi:hypothetical protein